LPLRHEQDVFERDQNALPQREDARRGDSDCDREYDRGELDYYDRDLGVLEQHYDLDVPHHDRDEQLYHVQDVFERDHGVPDYDLDQCGVPDYDQDCGVLDCDRDLDVM